MKTNDQTAGRESGSASATLLDSKCKAIAAYHMIEKAKELLNDKSPTDITLVKLLEAELSASQSVVRFKEKRIEYLKEILADLMNKTSSNYDFNADPDKMTLKVSQACN